MSGSTALSAAFAKAGGYDENEAVFRTDLARYLNNGGTIERVQNIVNELMREVRDGGASKGQGTFDDAHQLNDGRAGQRERAEEANVRMPALPSTKARESGLHASDEKSTRSVPAPRDPSAASVIAMRSIGRAAALSALDRIKTADGRAWGDVGPHELDGMMRDGALAAAVKKNLGALSNSQRFMPLRKLISAPKFEMIVKSVREAANAG